MTVALLSGLVLIGSVACNNGGGGGGSATPTPGSYYMSNGQCYSTGGVATSLSYCGTTSGSVGYQVINGQCVYTATNQPVAPTYCMMGTQTSTISNYPTGVYPGQYSYGVTPGMCSGVLYYAVNGYIQPVWCDYPYIDNCAGYTLINAYGMYEYCM